MTDPGNNVVPPRPLNEQERLQELYRSRILDSEAEAAFDDLALLAAHIAGTPLASVNFLDDEVQWSKAAAGVDRAQLTLDRDATICSYAILDDGVLELPDLQLDERTASNPTLRAFGLRYYAGAPVRTRAGHALGTVCVLDVVPRSLTPSQLGALGALARQAAVLLEWRLTRPSLRSELVRRRVR